MQTHVVQDEQKNPQIMVLGPDGWEDRWRTMGGVLNIAPEEIEKAIREANDKLRQRRASYTNYDSTRLFGVGLKGFVN